MSNLVLVNRNNLLVDSKPYWRLSNEDFEHFYLLQNTPNKINSFILGKGNYAIVDQEIVDLLEIIIILNNEKTLTQAFWKKNIKRLPLTCVVWLRNNFNQIPYNYEGIRGMANVDFSTHNNQSQSLINSIPSSEISSYNDTTGGLPAPPERDFDTFDFGGGDTGGGGAGGDN